MQVERVDFVNIATRDADRSRAWYRDTFGLEPDPNNPDELTAGQVTLTFWEPEKENIDFTPDVGGFALRVGDVDAAKAELEAKGLKCAGFGGLQDGCLPRSRRERGDPPPAVQGL